MNGARRHMAYALCSDEEYAYLLARAKAEGVSISNYVRRCINSAWLEEGDDAAPLLADRVVGFQKGAARRRSGANAE